MDWNGCWSVKTVTPFLVESSGDSEEVKSNGHQEHEAFMDVSEGVSFRFEEEEEEDDDDDAQSCSYDHSSYINTSYGSSQHDQDQPQRLIYDDLEDDNIDDDDDGDIYDDDDNSKMDSSKQQKGSHKFCGDLLNQSEIDRKFWEACLAS